MINFIFHITVPGLPRLQFSSVPVTLYFQLNLFAHSHPLITLFGCHWNIYLTTTGSTEEIPVCFLPPRIPFNCYQRTETWLLWRILAARNPQGGAEMVIVPLLSLLQHPCRETAEHCFYSCPFRSSLSSDMPDRTSVLRLFFLFRVRLQGRCYSSSKIKVSSSQMWVWIWSEI